MSNKFQRQRQKKTKTLVLIYDYFLIRLLYIRFEILETFNKDYYFFILRANIQKNRILIFLDW